MQEENDLGTSAPQRGGLNIEFEAPVSTFAPKVLNTVRRLMPLVSSPLPSKPASRMNRG
jgi:hypothetical protein